MSLEKPIKCKNCGKENAIWWDEPYVPGRRRNRPFDIDRYKANPTDKTKWWHECKPKDAEGHPPNTDYMTKPFLHDCVFKPCEFEVIFNPQRGEHCEGAMDGPRHWCLHMPSNYVFDPNNPGQKRLKPELQQKADEYNRRLQELKAKKATEGTLKPGLTPNALNNNITNILQIQTDYLRKILETIEVLNRYQRIIKDCLMEWREEMKDMAIQNPSVNFESGRIVVDRDPIEEQEEDKEDIYDEISDTDDETRER